MAASSLLMSGNVRVHVVCDYCPQPDGWRPMISMWHVQDGVYVRGSYQLLLPDDFAAHIRRLSGDGQLVPLEYDRELQRARDRERS
jgi:hypothetical protein